MLFQQGITASANTAKKAEGNENNVSFYVNLLLVDLDRYNAINSSVVVVAKVVESSMADLDYESLCIF